MTEHELVAERDQDKYLVRAGRDGPVLAICQSVHTPSGIVKAEATAELLIRASKATGDAAKHAVPPPPAAPALEAALKQAQAEVVSLRAQLTSAKALAQEALESSSASRDLAKGFMDERDALRKALESIQKATNVKDARAMAEKALAISSDAPLADTAR